MKKPPPPSLRQVFAANLRGLRRVKDMSQEELAGRADLSRTYVSSVERGERNVSIDSIEKLAGALEIQPMTLMDPAILQRMRDEIGD
ncbi:helix-turn-helix domain-containing protein [Paraburkholderia azotifigens]|uniref:Helix-turn-helix transcriptional regulator n=1 Tax=Paraburkholderia azotifigens TaxID=2057004 RepID=A0A5C6VU80_9BURK|nr:helix-turn-helix transcriptional regulator [Paraburkholderia azotifigens]TXC88166.1 helix-turn-helix transcriptional regulator [Paraburkholderia azotifigens]